MNIEVLFRLLLSINIFKNRNIVFIVAENTSIINFNFVFILSASEKSSNRSNFRITAKLKRIINLQANFRVNSFSFSLPILSL